MSASLKCTTAAEDAAMGELVGTVETVLDALRRLDKDICDKDREIELLHSELSDKDVEIARLDARIKDLL